MYDQPLLNILLAGSESPKFHRASMTTYLRNYVGSVSELPGELARKFKLMRELDDKAHALQAEAEAAARQRLEELAQKVDP